MTTNLTFDFIVDKENKKIVIKREFAAALSLVWKAYTNPQILDQWWGPKPWKTLTKFMDFHEGGLWLYAMVGPEGQEHWSMFKYKTIQPENRFTGLDAFTNEKGYINESLPQSNWDVTFNQKGENTLVEKQISFTDLGQLEAILQTGFQEGITTTMNFLDELLPTLKK
jgi:uncharacterized protein YndB with AHSA1/START domain